MVAWYVWAGFVSFVFLLLAVDLGLFHRRAHTVETREALISTGIWVGVALAFAVVLALWRGGGLATQYLAGYLIEWSLSVDNVFVFVLVLSHFAVPPEYQHRVLFWGVVGAILLRLGFVLGGAALLHRFHWVVYVFGAILLLTAARFLRREGRRSVEDSPILRVFRRVVPMSESYQGQRLVIRRNHRTVATPLLAVLVLIEATDVVFAIDSIPAIFSVTTDAFVVFASNALAILGLRSLYFLLAGAVGRFRYLRPGLAVLLAFVGTKMLLSSVVQVPIGISLAAIVAILGGAVLASWLRRGEPRQAPV